jgi:hypothetical protein
MGTNAFGQDYYNNNIIKDNFQVYYKQIGKAGMYKEKGRALGEYLGREDQWVHVEDIEEVASSLKEEKRTATRIGFWIGGGMSANMNDLDPTYFKSLGGQFNMGIEIYKQNFSFIRVGINMDLGYLDGVEKDEVEKNMPNAIADSAGSYAFRINAFAKLQPVDFLFISGGIGWGLYGAWVQKVDIVDISTLVFPVGGGIFLGNDRAGVALEGLYNIVPLDGRTANYISVNAQLKVIFTK